VAHIDNESLTVFSHGRAEALATTDDDWTETIEHWTAHYGSFPLTWGDNIVMDHDRPQWMFGHAADQAAVLPHG
jgi:hypothetical protein